MFFLERWGWVSRCISKPYKPLQPPSTAEPRYRLDIVNEIAREQRGRSQDIRDRADKCPGCKWQLKVSTRPLAPKLCTETPTATRDTSSHLS